MKKLTLKTFLVLLALSLTISIFAYVCIWLFLPYANERSARKELQQRTEELVETLRASERADSEGLFTGFIRETGADILLMDRENNPVSLVTFQKREGDIIEGERHPFKFTDSPEEYVLVIRYNSSRSEEMGAAIGNSIPFVAVIIIALSFGGAFIFSHYTTRPIIRIQQIADRMANLDFSWYCPDVREDEIGMLSRSINELSDKLHQALDELYSRNSILEEEIALEKERERRRMLFFSGVSHELKTPIAIVIGQIEGMQAQIGVYKDRDKYLARSGEILQSLNQFIKEVLLVSHMDMWENKELLPVNLSELTADLVREYSEYAVENSLNVEEDISPDIFVIGEEALLKKALANVISNAITHSATGGRVRIRLSRDKKKAEFTVTNSPAHIEEEHLPHLFEAFYRVNKSAAHGSGLGLYITRMILETYHVPHFVENTEDGVRFTALLQEVSS